MAKTGRQLCAHLPFPTLVMAMSGYQHARPFFSKPSSVHIPHKQLPLGLPVGLEVHTQTAQNSLPGRMEKGQGHGVLGMDWRLFEQGIPRPWFGRGSAGQS